MASSVFLTPGTFTIAGNVIVTGVVNTGNGTAAAPAQSYISDPATGQYLIGASNEGFSAGGVLRWDYNTTRILSTIPFRGPDTGEAFGFATDNDTYIARGGADIIDVVTGGGSYLRVDSATGTILRLGTALQWGSSGVGSVDLSLFRDAANTLAQRNGTNTQIFNLYNTYTSATNYERVGFNWAQSANRFRIESVKGSGGGTARPIDFTDGATALMTVDPVASNVQIRTLMAIADNTNDFGAAGANRFRTGYFGTSVVSGGTVTAGGLTPSGILGTPVVVATGRVTAQSAANASISTFTVGAADASFEVSGNMNVTASTTLITTLTVTYTDESNTARSMILPIQSLAGSFIAAGAITGAGATIWESPVMHIRCKAATVITILTSAGTFTGVTYTAEGVIKQTK